MKSAIVLVSALLLAVSQVSAFTSLSSFSGSSISANTSNGNGITMEYIPSGMSKAQWKKMKEAEKKKSKGQNLGKSGITTFTSRSFDDWQKAGGKNLFPVDPRSVKNAKDLPYMQRPGGSADDSDLGGKKKGLFNFSFGKKKKEPEPEPEPPKKKSPWTF
mmetsp:Transcript_27494/g.64479  ORF Transcript_27494/g.64479 Transcript_27494/m.64479 type:complete len:160 (-) Transcript_27494:1427-1906(-)